MKKKVYDYIIIGQGLAGTALAVHLLRMERSVLIFNHPAMHSSSKAAAGIYNPITGRRWVTTWKAEELFGYFPKYYKEMELLTNSKFFFEKPVFRSFQNLKDQNQWVNKSDHETPGFVKEIISPGQYSEFIEDSYGGILLNNSGYLDVNLYLEKMREYFERENILKEEVVNLQSVTWKSPFTINEYVADNVILCMGYEGSASTPFGASAFRSVKGELLLAESEIIFPNVIFNGPVFILKRNDGIIKIGATYDFEDKSLEVTDKAKNKLLEKAKSYLKSEVKILRQVAGFRPSSVDRRPLLGRHPDIQNLGILNGLGTKGVSLAPYMAKLLVENFENGKELDREIDIKRFFK